MLFQGKDRIRLKEPASGFSLDHWIYDQRNSFPTDVIRYRFHDLGRVEHAGLGPGNGKVVCDRFKLGSHLLRREGKNPLHSQSVLGGDSGQGGCSVQAQNGEGLDVCLDSGSATGIRSAYGQHYLWHVSNTSGI